MENGIRIGKIMFQRMGRTYVMGILNVTPDSFSDGGKWNTIDMALRHVEKMTEEGADIVDIGGESTRPGYTMIDEQEEIERVTPVIEQVKSRFDIPISLDTYKSGVAKAGIAAGADMVNDIWGLKYDAGMADVIAKSGLPCCLMHNRNEASYKNLMPELMTDLTESIRIAESAGIDKGNIILDPGVGFGKSLENNLEVINSLELLGSLGCPILLGCSRKSVIGLTLGLPVEDRLEGTLAATVVGVMKGCSFVRVHDVKENVRVIRMTEAIMNGGSL